MAKVKFKIGALQDFVLPVKFIMPNGEEETIRFKVRHKKSKEVEELFEREASNVEFIQFIASGWDLEEEFSEDNITELCDLFPSIPLQLPQDYFRALAGVRVKN